MKKIRSVLCMLLTLAMVLSMFPLAYAADCEHLETEVAWDTNYSVTYTVVDENWHEISGYQYTYCTTCFKRVGDSFTAKEQEVHALNVDGLCDTCGYNSTCEHEPIWVNDEEYSNMWSSSSINDTQHEVSYVQFPYCTKCGKQVGESQWGPDVIEDHIFGDNDWCDVCSYRRNCPHEDITTDYQRYTAGYESVSDTQHVWLVNEFDYCNDCNKRIGEYRLVRIDIYSDHTLDKDGVCTGCGYVSCDDPIQEFEPSYGAVKEITGGTAATPELNYLLDYLIDWTEAYEQWVDSVEDGLQDYSSTQEESRENIIRQEAERMRIHDQNTYSRYLTGQIQGYESQAYHALASFFYDGIATKVPDISSVDLSKDLAGLTLINTMMQSMSGSSKSYYYGNISVSISASSMMSVNFGSMTIEDNRGTFTVVDDVIQTLTICSDIKECRNALRAYMSELQDLGLNASYNVANAVTQDILGKSLETLTSEYVNKAILKIENKLAIKLDEKLGQAGVGENLVKTLDECYSFYTWVKKCINLGTQEEVDKALSNVMNLSFEDTTVSKGATKKAMKAMRKANEKMQRAFREYLNGTIAEKEESFWRWLFGCPVSISVFDSSGEQIGYVSEDDLWHTDAISIKEIGGVKEIISYTADELSIVVTAEDNGTMSCMFEKYDASYAPVGRLNYYNIILEPEQVFQVSIPDNLEEKTDTQAITSNGETILPDEYISAQDSAGVTISCDSVTEDGTVGGTVSGTGTYIKGDSVILRAESYEGFKFVGWFQEEHLVCTEQIYEFPAREDYKCVARFYRIKPIAIELETEDGGIAIGAGRYDSSETVTLVAVPDDGNSFAGWHVGDTLVSTDVEYIFTASESLTLRASFTQAQEPLLLGDVTGDGKVTATDYSRLLAHVKKVSLITDADSLWAADVTGDGKITATDYSRLLAHVKKVSLLW